MDNDFAKKAFDKAEKARMEKESVAWGDFIAKKSAFAERLSFELAVGESVGIDKFTALLKAAQDANVTDVLHAYREYSMMYGFKGGYQAGQMSMIEEAAK